MVKEAEEPPVFPRRFFCSSNLRNHFTFKLKFSLSLYDLLVVWVGMYKPVIDFLNVFVDYWKQISQLLLF